MSYESITAEMIQALEEEIEAIKKDGGTRQVALQAGIRKGAVGSRVVYTFLMSSELTVLDDTPAKLRIGDEAYDVVVVSTEGFEVAIAVKSDLGDKVATASLDLSSYFLLEQLQKRLGEAMAGKIQVDKAMALRLFNQLPNETLADSQPPRFENDSEKVNSEQKESVRRAVMQRITFVWGPPGTGKTTIISHLARILKEQGERLLVTSHTNIAVDSALKTVLDSLDPAERESGIAIRVGNPQDQDPVLIAATVESIAGRKTGDLRAEQQRTEDILKHAQGELDTWLGWERSLQSLQGLEERLRRETARLNAARQNYETEVRRIRGAEQELQVLQQRLEEALESGVLRRLFKGLNPQKLTTDIGATEARLTQLQSALSAKNGEVQEAKRSVDEATNALATARQEVERAGRVPTAKEVADGKARSTARVSEIEGHLATLAAQIAAIEETVIREAKVVGATLSRLTITPELYRSAFDTVIVDEVGMVPQPHLWFAASLAGKRVVVLGDPRQLAPISVADPETYPTAAQRLRVDIFEEAGVVREGRVQGKDTRLAALRRQYRMHPKIGDLANLLVYTEDQNPLEHCATVENLIRGLEAPPESEQPLVLCDTSAVEPWAARPTGSFSRYNIYSALVTVRLAQQVANGSGTRSVGIMTPYVAQARLLQTLARQHGLEGKVHVANIHRFQGNEKDVILIDLVDGPPDPPSRLFKDTDGSKRLLNVAFTRAKGKLILISNLEYFQRSRADHWPVTVAHNYLLTHARHIDSRNVVAGYGDPEILGAERRTRRFGPLPTPENMGIYDESLFYDAFLNDLASAKDYVVIFSPFLRTGRTAQLFPTLRHLLDRGIKVFLFTRDERAASDAERARVIADLRQLGVQVTPRRNLHEKVAFIDERVAWFGSLNIFSQSRSSEQMIRFADSQVVKHMAEFAGVTGVVRAARKKEEKGDFLRRFEPLLEKHVSRPNCPQCGALMVLRLGAMGPFYGCSNFPRCEGTINISRATFQAIVESLAIPCPGCGVGRMTLKWSKYGAFLGCNRYPEDITKLPLEKAFDYL